MIGFKQKPTAVTGIVIAVSVLLTACGESDLEQLQLDEIAAAQQEASELTPIGSENEPTPNVDPETPGSGGEDVTDPPTDVEKTAVEALLEDYQMVFSDEFNGSTLDSNKWNTQYQWGPDLIVNDEEQYYVDINNNPDFGYNPFSFDGESLIITADRTPTDLNDAAKEQAYLSGTLTSLGLFDMTYGYVEIRAKLPEGKGFWPGFWMLGTEFVDRKPQLYIMENRGDNTSIVYHRYNYSDDQDQFVYSDLLQSSGQNFHDEFHTYGVEWSEGQVTFYVDGELQHTIQDENISSQDMYFILNLAVGGWFPEAPDDTTTFPGVYTIDYIRAYQKS
ncbi:MAG: glycoside hydrolase family 16 protein [Gammaproteobacteria bacterium]|nr:glycoside hydrolase family 16 protein [Gammaproteobacteria bacterium]